MFYFTFLHTKDYNIQNNYFFQLFSMAVKHGFLFLQVFVLEVLRNNVRT